jgi:hypothetical protein
MKVIEQRWMDYASNLLLALDVWPPTVEYRGRHFTLRSVFRDRPYTTTNGARYTAEGETSDGEVELYVWDG